MACEDILFVRQQEQQSEKTTEKIDVLAIGLVVAWVSVVSIFLILPFWLGNIWPWSCP